MQKPARKQGRNTQLDSTQASSVQTSPQRVNRTAAQVDDIAITNVRASAPAATVENSVIAACSAVADELIASRILIDALEKENALLNARHQTDQQMIDLLSELNETRNAEADALRSTIAAKGEAITAKDAVIASQDKLIDALKRKKSSPWKRLGDVLIGVGIMTVFK